MSTNVTIFNAAQVPDFVRNRTGLSALATALAGAGMSGPRISIKGGTFRLIKDGKEVTRIDERYLDVVIVNAAPTVNRVWYGVKYDPDTVSAPACWSADGKVPGQQVANKQSETCDACPQNIAGSGEGDSRACRFQQQLALVLANDMEGDVLNLSVPAKSLFGKAEGENRPLQDYARWLKAQNVDPGEVITRMKFDTSAESPKLFWKPMRWLTNEEHDVAVKQGATDEAKEAIKVEFSAGSGAAPAAPVTDSLGARPERTAAPAPAATPPTSPMAEVEPPAPAPKARKPRAAAAPEPAKTAPEPDAPPPPEPTVRKEAVAASSVPERKATLAAMVDDWDDGDE